MRIWLASIGQDRVEKDRVIAFVARLVLRDNYGIANRTAEGSAPDWQLTAMVMNHYKRPKSFFIRTRIFYTTEPRTSATPVVIGNCAHRANAMAYDVGGGGPPGVDDEGDG